LKISIITVCFNSDKTIQDTINSVVSQIYNDIEYIIIDGQSKDKTIEIINSCKITIDKIVSEPDLGIYDAMNKGVRLASGDVIGFLNSDDVFYDPYVVQKIANAFNLNPSLDAVYGDLLMVSKNDLNKVIRYWRPGAYRHGLCLKGWIPPHPAFYVKRSVLLSSGGFDLRYTLQSDVDLMMRLFEIIGISTSYVPSVFVRQRFGGATTGNPMNIFRGNLESFLSFRRNGFGLGFSFFIKKIISRLGQFISRPNN
jgi:glycosyltransferase involved in cell wall biosynthesis